jgi:phage terminase large subunit
MSAQITVNLNLPDKLDFLLGQDKRYKVLKGGRGSSKSWSIARALLIRGMRQKQRALCCRELQKSIKESVHQLLANQIAELGLQDFYTVLNTEIRGRRGTGFGFAGLRHNATEIKSYEDADVAWVEEAQVVSKNSWNILVPTIRNQGSEIWVSYNPELEDDYTHQFCLHLSPENAIVVDMNWRDNPWFPEVLRMEKDEKFRTDPDGALHIWEGHCKQVLEGAIYVEELRKAKLENRITDVPYDRTKPVHTFWDLGWNSVTGRTAVLMAQSVNATYRVIDYHEGAQHTVDWHIAELQKRGYVWGTDWLPHDAESTNLPAGGRTVAKIMKALGRTVRVLPRRPIEEGHMAVKTIFGQTYFDKNKTSDLIQCLNRYRYEVDEETGLRSKKPEESIWKHGADATRTMGMAITEEQKPKKKEQTESRTPVGAQGWMG